MDDISLKNLINESNNLEPFPWSLVPVEIKQKIFSSIIPEHLAKLALVNKEFNAAIKDNLIWKDAFYKHFPQHIPRVKSKKQTDWFREFGKFYSLEYKDWDLCNARATSCVINNDFDTFKKLNLMPGYFMFPQYYNSQLLQLARGYKRFDFLNYIYEQICDIFFIIKTSNPFIISTSKTLFDEKTVLWWALMCLQNKEVIIKLIKQGSSLDEIYEEGITPLHIACENGVLEIVKLLLDKNPQLINAIDDQNRTPLLLATRGLAPYKRDIDGTLTSIPRSLGAQHIATIAYLINQQANVHAVIDRLWIRVVRPQHIDQYYDLKTIGVGNGDYEKTALYFAVINRCYQVVELLLTAGARDQKTNGKGWSTIHFAAHHRDFHIVKMLIAHQPDLINREDGFGATALSIAVRQGNHEMVQYLIDHGAEIDIKVKCNKDRFIGTHLFNIALSTGNGDIMHTILKNIPRLYRYDIKKLNELGYSETIITEIALKCYISKKEWTLLKNKDTNVLHEQKKNKLEKKLVAAQEISQTYYSQEYKTHGFFITNYTSKRLRHFTNVLLVHNKQDLTPHLA